MVFLALDHLSGLQADHEFAPVVGEEQAFAEEVDAGVDDCVFVAVAEDVDELSADELPLLDALHAAGEEAVVAAGPEAHRLHLPGLLVRVGHGRHDLLVLHVDHEQLAHRVHRQPVDDHPRVVLRDDHVEDLHQLAQVEALQHDLQVQLPDQQAAGHPRVAGQQQLPVL